MYIHRHAEGVDDGVADVAVDGVRVERKIFVRAAGFDLEAAAELGIARDGRPCFGHGGGGDGVDVERRLGPGRDGNQAEDAFQAGAGVFAGVVGDAHHDAAVG